MMHSLKGRKLGPNPNHYLYKGENASYMSLHGWVRRHKIDPCKCEICGVIDVKLQWANKSHEYKRDLNDWIRLCIPCHRKHDLDENGNKRRDSFKFPSVKQSKKRRFSDEEIIEIFLSPLSPKELSIRYKTRNSEISRIQTRERYARITKGLNKIDRTPFHVKLNAAKVMEIFNSKIEQKQLAEIYGVSEMTVSDIKTGRCWSSVTGKKLVLKYKKKVD